MKNLFLLLIITFLGSCAVSNTSLNDSKKVPQNAKLLPSANQVNLLRTKFLDNGNDLRIYVNFMLEDSMDVDRFLGKYSANYTVIKDLLNKEKGESRNIAISESNVEIIGKLASFYFDLPKPKTDNNQSVLKVEVTERGVSAKMVNEINLRANSLRTTDNFGLFRKKSDHLLLANFVNFSDSLIVKSLVNNNEMPITMVRYVHEFDPSTSPTAVGLKNAPKPLYVDSLIQIKSNNAFVLGQEAMFYFLKDTTDRSGFSVLGVDSRYPKITKPAKLIKPMIYFTTNQEYQSLNSNLDSKNSFDQFWLGLYNGNQASAKKTIKNLYQKVSEANTMFTTYKEGWKTDKGMVYIIMGKPDQVRFLKDKEVWVFTKNAKYSEVNFTFNKRPNQFIEDHFELNRYAEFQPIWYPAVEAWRIGEK